MFNWIKALPLSLPRAEQTQRERERERCARAEQSRRRERERERERGVRAEQSRRRERGVCALNRADAERERGVRAEQSRRRERERCVRALGEQDLALARQYRWFSETRFGRFFEGKKVTKGVCNVPKLATLCISISPTRGWATGQTENTRCVNRALKKLVPLKWVCVNALTLTALIYTYILCNILYISGLGNGDPGGPLSCRV